MYCVAQPLRFGKEIIWTYRTIEESWFVYREGFTKLFTVEEAQGVKLQYPDKQICIIHQSEVGSF